MFKVSIMKSLLTLTPFLSNSTALAPLSFHFSSQFCILPHTATKNQPLKSPKFIPAVLARNSLVNYANPSSSNQSRGLCTESGASGEIHVIVGPMFAGKTTTLLKRMKSENSNGRLDGFFFFLCVVNLDC